MDDGVNYLGSSDFGCGMSGFGAVSGNGWGWDGIEWMLILLYLINSIIRLIDWYCRYLSIDRGGINKVKTL